MKNINWGQLTYEQKHDRMRGIKKKPEACELCGEKRPLDLANIGHEYRPDPDEWRYLCRRCHRRADKKDAKPLKECPECQAIFTPKNKRQIFCGMTCSNRFKAMRRHNKSPTQ